MIAINGTTLFILNAIIGVLAVWLGCLLIFSFSTLKKTSDSLNRILFQEHTLEKYRVGIGLVMIIAAAYIFWGLYYVSTH